MTGWPCCSAGTGHGRASCSFVGDLSQVAGIRQGEWSDGPERGTRVSGGGRSFVIASSPVTSVAAARALGGLFLVQLRDADPHGGGAATVESPVFEIRVDLCCYEFEAETDERA